MTTQEMIERDVRMALGDLHVQLIMARARVVELEQILAEQAQAELDLDKQPPAKPNGKNERRQEPAPQ